MADTDSVDVEALAGAVEGALATAMWLPPGPSRAWRCGVHPEIGALCLEHATTVDEVPAAVSRAASSAEDMRLAFDRLEIDPPMVTKVVVPAQVHKALEGRNRRSVIGTDQLAELDRAWDPSPDVLDAVRRELWPAAVFSAIRQRPTDENRTAREDERVALDGAQLAVAASFDGDTVEVRGPAGSGKTLVLVARARMLLEAHPDWTVQLICFNRTLVTYIQSLVADLEGVRVETIFEFARRHQLRFDFTDERQGAPAARKAEKAGVGAGTVDALLIDETQDIHGWWQSWAASCVRPDRGGTLVVGDARQSLYQDDPSNGLAVDRVVDLDRAYRSTRQIMDVAQQVASTEVHHLATDPPEGVSVQLIYGERWDRQAEAVANEIEALIEAGDYGYGDIAVLYTRKASQARRLTETLEEGDIPFHWVNRDPEAKRSLVPDVVTVSTVHSAKGREFPVVFVFGVEALKAAEARQRNIGYVAATRAKDQLFLTYTRPNDMIRAISDHDDVESWTWPDDWGN